MGWDGMGWYGMVYRNGGRGEGCIGICGGRVEWWEEVG